MNGEEKSKTGSGFAVLLLADDDDSIGVIKRGLVAQGLRETALEIARDGRTALRALGENGTGAKILLVDLDVAGREFFAGLPKLPHHREWKLFVFASPDHDYDPAIPVDDSIAGFLQPAKRSNDYSNLAQLLRYHSETNRTTSPNHPGGPENPIAGCGSAGLQPRAPHHPATRLLDGSIHQ